MISPATLSEYKAAGRRIAALTAYSYPMARLLDEAGVDLILVGDSVAMVEMGLRDTVDVGLEAMIHYTRATAPGARNALLTTDLPAGSYDTPAEALASASRLREAGAAAVKLEGAGHRLETIKELVAAGIPVVAHLGMLPQHVREERGYHIKGRKAEEATALQTDALAVEKAGACSVVLELVHPPVAAAISRGLGIPTIGIGSGGDCDGEILVLHDLIGLFPWFKPSFATSRADVAGEISRATREYIAGVRG